MKTSLRPASLLTFAVWLLVFCAACKNEKTDAVTLILRNGNLITLDITHPQAQALAISGKRIIAVGSNAEIDALKQADTKVYDLNGQTVIPGLNDSHFHGIRGGQTYTWETYWYADTTLASALQKLQQAAQSRQKPDEWVAVAGSWHPNQFAEKRAPTVADLTAAVPDRPAYVQYLYDYAIVNTAGIEALKLNDEKPKLPKDVKVEKTPDGKATGKLYGTTVSFNALVMQLSEGTDRKASMQAFFAELNKYGLTAMIDPAPGGEEALKPLNALDKSGDLTVRTLYRLSPEEPGDEARWFEKNMKKPDADKEALVRVFGMGENLVFEMNDGVRQGPGFNPPPKAREELLKVATFAAEKGYPIEIHCYTDDAANIVLDIFQTVAQKHPLQNLRWAVAHLNTATPQTYARLKALGLAYTVQMGHYFEAPAIRDSTSAAVAQSTPRTKDALAMGIPVAGGTDATRIGKFGVWDAIQYHITGVSLGGAMQQKEALQLNRLEALRLYTTGAAWLAFDEAERGSLTKGKLADIAVLDKPYFTIPESQIHTIRSMLTLVNGKVVYDAAATHP